MRWGLAIILALSAAPAEAGLGSLLAKLGKAGSSAGKVAKAGKVVKAAKFAKAGAGLAGVSGAVAAERAGFALGGLADDAARSASYVAKAESGEVLMITRAGGEARLSPQGTGLAVEAMATEGAAPPTVFLDASAAASPEVVAALPARTQLVLVEDARTLPLRRKPEGKAGDLVVDTVDGAIDLGDYLGAGEDEEESSSVVPTVLGVLLVGTVVWMLVRKKPHGPTPA